MPLSVILLLFPLIASLILLIFCNNVARVAALIFAAIQLVVTGIMLYKFVPAPEAQFIYDVVWVKDMGISLSLGVDGINILFIILTNFILFIAVLLTFEDTCPRYFYTLLFLIQFALLGVFMSFDALLFYFFWEVALIPTYLLISYWGIAPNRIKITFRFFCYTMFGSLLMLFGIIYVYTKTEIGSFDILSFYKANLSIIEQKWIFWAFFIAFAIKIPIFPFHSWQRDTYVVSPYIGSIILSALMLKMGIYGAVRWLMPMFSDVLEGFKTLIIILCLVNIIYGGVAALYRKNIKALIAYSSLSHVGLIFLGVIILSVTSLEGALFQAFNHGLVVTALFAITQIIYRRLNTHIIKDMGGGLSVYSRGLTVGFFLILLSAVAFPLTGGFIGEFMLLKAVSSYSIVVASIAVLTVILSAVYMLRLFKNTMLGESANNISFRALTFSEGASLIILGGVTMIIGLYPYTITSLIEPSVKNLLYFIQFIKSS